MNNNPMGVDSDFVSLLTQGDCDLGEIHVPDLLSLIEAWHAILRKQRQLIDLPDKDILVAGDIHGDYTQVRRAFSLFEEEELDYLIFNGDIVDRGLDMMECLLHIIAAQLRYPDQVYFLRGNHELRSINEIYGFRGYCNGLWGSQVYEAFNEGFQDLPIALKIADWGFVCHGGVPNTPIYFHLMRLEPKQKEPKTGPYAQLLWNDPDPRIENFAPSPRGDNFYRFGMKAFREFMVFHNLSYFIRAHQAFPEGYRWFFEDKLLSLFSSQAGPYNIVDPHFARLTRKRIELIPCSSIEI